MGEGIKLTALKMAFIQALDLNLHLRDEKNKIQNSSNKNKWESSNWDKAIKTSSDSCRALDKEITNQIKNKFKKP